MINFTAREMLPSSSPADIQCLNCSSNQHLDCVIHRKRYECRTLFTWDIETGDWNILEYGDMTEMQQRPANKRNQTTTEVNVTAKKLANDLKSFVSDVFSNLRVLDSNVDKSKELLRDYDNSIEFYLYNKSSRNLNHLNSFHDIYSDASNFD